MGTTETGEPLIKMSKLTNKELYKPPTNEEVHRLMETQNLFHSNLLKLQIAEMLKEVSIQESKRKKVDDFLHSLHGILNELPEGNKFKLNRFKSVIKTDISVPMQFNPEQVKVLMVCGPPSGVKVVGSYMLHTELKQNLIIDLLLCLPNNCMQEKDYLNQRYIRKRAIYLAYLAKCLSDNELISSCAYSFIANDPQRPILTIKPNGKLSTIFKIHIHVSPPLGHFKDNRFLPDISNLRKSWYWNKETDESDNSIPSPHYNHVVSQDLFYLKHLEHLHAIMSDFESLRDAVKLMKIWLRQRDLCQGYGAFNGFIVNMLLSYLFSKHKINKQMSSYQIVRITFQFLASTNWMEKGIALCEGVNLDMFSKFNTVVFVDNTGKINMCANMPSSIYLQVCHEARLSLSILDNKSVSNNFDAVFMVKVPFVRKFDHLIHFTKENTEWKTMCDKLALSNSIPDFGGNLYAVVVPKLLSILQHGLKDRVLLIGVQYPCFKEWDVKSAAPQWFETATSLTLGLLLNDDNYTVPLEKGPLADSPEALDFRSFWGERSDLRRFQDSTIREAVLWSHDNQHTQRSIPKQICNHLLQRHCNFVESGMSWVGNQIEEFLIPAEKGKSAKGSMGAGDEELGSIVATYNQFCVVLRNIKNLSLSINSLQGISPSLRFTEVFPPSKIFVETSSYSKKILKNIEVPVPGRLSQYTPAIEVICHMEGSGKWPQDAEALERVKAAFHVSLAKELRCQCKNQIACAATKSHVDVWFKGYVFRVTMAYHREITVLQTFKSKDGMVKIRSTPKSLELEKRTAHMPWLNSTLHGLHQKHKAFGLTCRLAKLWINSKLLSRHLSPEAVELICAKLFTDPYPFIAPNSAQVGLLRFLWFLATFDFKRNPIIINIAEELGEKDLKKIEEHFTKNRNSMPPIFIATATDKTHSVWTTTKPIPTILYRLKSLATISYKSMQDALISANKINFQEVFECSVSPYDILIQLEPKWLVKKPRPSSVQHIDKELRYPLLPVVNFNPVDLYLQELEEAYGDVALFFYNENGGSSIGILWKPKAFNQKAFKIANLDRMMLDDDRKSLILNVNAIIEDFKIMGNGLVSTIELRTEKWKV